MKPAFSHPGTNWRLNNSKTALLITLLQILVKGEKHYCKPHPDRLLELLQQYHRIKIERRWFFQCMRDLEDAGFIFRQRRWEKLQEKIIRSKTSLWFFTIKGAQFLKAKAINGAKELLARMLAWMNRDDSRAPGLKIYQYEEQILPRDDALKKVRKLINDIFT